MNKVIYDEHIHKEYEKLTIHSVIRSGFYDTIDGYQIIKIQNKFGWYIWAVCTYANDEGVFAIMRELE